MKKKKSKLTDPMEKQERKNSKESTKKESRRTGFKGVAHHVKGQKRDDLGNDGRSGV